MSKYLTAAEIEEYGDDILDALKTWKKLYNNVLLTTVDSECLAAAMAKKRGDNNPIFVKRLSDEIKDGAPALGVRVGTRELRFASVEFVDLLSRLNRIRNVSASARRLPSGQDIIDVTIANPESKSSYDYHVIVDDNGRFEVGGGVGGPVLKGGHAEDVLRTIKEQAHLVSREHMFSRERSAGQVRVKTDVGMPASVQRIVGMINAGGKQPGYFSVGKGTGGWSISTVDGLGVCLFAW